MSRRLGRSVTAYEAIGETLAEMRLEAAAAAGPAALQAARAILARILIRVESEALKDHQVHALLSEEIERIDVVLAQAKDPAPIRVPVPGPGRLT